MNIHTINCEALEKLCKNLSNDTLKVRASYVHVTDRTLERKIPVEKVLVGIRRIVSEGDFCIDVFESAISDGGKKNFKKYREGIRIYYSVQVVPSTYKINVIIRTVV